jgi:glucosamine--fructose-6-phosphate aminotransferase (isomerizing)
MNNSQAVLARCVRCLMPSTYPDITFDSQGVCNHCRSYQKLELLGENRFLEKIHSQHGASYDCVVGISGGKDSCYVAYLAKKKFGLRTLAITYDFPFMVDLARRNTKTVCENLGIELLVVKSRNNFEYNLLRNHLISLAATGTTWGQCMFCHYGIEAILYNAAKSRHIPFILSGVTESETWWNPGNRIDILAKRLKKLPLGEIVNFGYYQSRAYLGLVDQHRQFPIPGNHSINVYQRAQSPSDGPETIPVFRYVKWEQDIIEKTLQEQTGWQKPAESLTWRYDCILEPLLDYTNKKEFGISSAGLYLCSLIRSGVITREEGLALLAEREDQTRLDTSLKTVLDFLKIPEHIQNKYTAASGFSIE